MGRKELTREWISKASIYPHRIVTYVVPEGGWQHSARQRLNYSNLSDNDTEGVLSIKARRKMEKAIMWLHFGAKAKRIFDHELQKSFTFHINFITLTLPAKQMHSDKEITNRCLGNWLDVAKKMFGLRRYVWKAETQENGNIHYHLVTDTYIHHKDLRRTWNKSLELLGYISAFEFKHRHRNAPTEQVKSIKNVRNVASYVACYMSKNRPFKCIGKLIESKGVRREILYGSDEYRAVNNWKELGKVVGSIIGGYSRPVNGRLWGCSRELSQIKPVKVGEDTHDFSVLRDFIERANLKRIDLDNACLFVGKVASEAKKHQDDIYQALEIVAGKTAIAAED